MGNDGDGMKILKGRKREGKKKRHTGLSRLGERSYLSTALVLKAGMLASKGEAIASGASSLQRIEEYIAWKERVGEREVPS